MPNRITRARNGFILVTVVIAILLIAMLAAPLQTVALRSDTQSRLGFAGEHALHAADNAIANRINTWNTRDFASMPIGARDTRTSHDNQQLAITTTLVRTAPLSAWIESDITNTNDGNTLAAHRRIARFIALATPDLPQVASLTTLGALTLDDPTAVSGADSIPDGWTTNCADSLRAPIAPIAATPLNAAIASTVPNAITIRDSIALRAQFDAEWNHLASRAALSTTPASPITLIPSDAGGVCTIASGEPRRGATATPACIGEWSARMLGGTPAQNNTVTLTGNSRFQGVLLIDGDLAIDGTLNLSGLLIVRGALSTTVTGSLDIAGAVLIRDIASTGSHLNSRTHIHYSRCATDNALAGIATPTARTSHAWFERP